MSISKVIATRAHAIFVAGNLRQGDCTEIQAYGFGPLQGCLYAVDSSLEAWAAMHGGIPIAIYGVSKKSITSDLSYPWVLSTHYVANCKMAFLRFSMREFIDVKSRHPNMAIEVMSAYILSMKWVNWLGFKSIGDISRNDVQFTRMVA